jgi:hypothetical protein
MAMATWYKSRPTTARRQAECHVALMSKTTHTGNTHRQIIMKPSNSRGFFNYFHADGLYDDDGGDRSADDNSSNDGGAAANA